MKRNCLIISLLLFVCELSSSCQEVNQIESNEESSINKGLVLQLINAYRTSGCDCGSEGYFAPAISLIVIHRIVIVSLRSNPKTNKSTIKK